tara:strand:- start:63 stop:926 length:864 start_codon:yes stop_codon:yes gene_type:complete
MEPIVVFSGIAFFTYEYNNNYAISSSAAFNIAWLYNWIKYKYNTKIKPCYTSVYQCNPKEYFRVEFIKDGQPIRTIIFTEEEEEELQNLATQITNYIKNPSEYDFILYKINENSRNDSNKMLLRYSTIPNTWKYTKSSANFLSLEIKYNGIGYNVSKDLGDFYIEHNTIFDAPFVKWYMKQRYNINIKDEYELTYMNEEFEVNTINQSQYITLTDSTYNIHSIYDVDHTVDDDNDNDDNNTTEDDNTNTTDVDNTATTENDIDDDVVEVQNTNDISTDNSGNSWWRW